MADLPTKFEFYKIKPDGYLETETESGKIRKIPLYTKDSQRREYGKYLITTLMQIHESDLVEGPSKGTL